MPYKITAIRDVVVCANMPTRVLDLRFGTPMPRPGERRKWVEIKKGESKVTNLVHGLHPSCAPDQPTSDEDGVTIVPMIYQNHELPKEFFGVLTMDYVAK